MSFMNESMAGPCVMIAWLLTPHNRFSCPPLCSSAYFYLLAAISAVLIIPPSGHLSECPDSSHALPGLLMSSMSLLKPPFVVAPRVSLRRTVVSPHISFLMT